MGGYAPLRGSGPYFVGFVNVNKTCYFLNNHKKYFRNNFSGKSPRTLLCCCCYALVLIKRLKKMEACFGKLPDEIWLKIFDHLSANFISKSIALVCKQFYRLSKDSSLIKEVVLQRIENKSNQDHIYEVLRSAIHLNTLILKNRKDAEFLVYMAMQHCPRLRRLELLHCNLTDDCR